MLLPRHVIPDLAHKPEVARDQYVDTMPRKISSRARSHPPAAVPNPDHAWKLLGLVNEWIRHSDSKAGVTLAFTGVLATMTFSLTKDFTTRTTLFDACVILVCLLLVTTAALCGWTLTPRINDNDADPEAINRVFFASISINFNGDRPRYGQVLSTLSADPQELVRDLADQIHANAKIATIKAKYAMWAIRSALAAGVAVALLAVVVGITNS